MPGQRRMFAVLRHLGLDNYIANEKVLGVAKEGQPTEEIETQRKWGEMDAKDTSIGLVTRMGDAEMIHISGATT